MPAYLGFLFVAKDKQFFDFCDDGFLFREWGSGNLAGRGG